MPEVKKESKETQKGGRARRNFGAFLLSLFLSFGLGVGLGLYFGQPSAEATSSISARRVILTALYIYKKAPGLSLAVVLGAVAILITAMLCAAYVVKPRGGKD